jgi:hypothetical protein
MKFEAPRQNLKLPIEKLTQDLENVKYNLKAASLFLTKSS